MENDAVRKIIWTGMLAASTALATVVGHRIASVVWVKVFNEEPPA